MRTLHIEHGQTGTLFIRDGERLECGVGAPGQPISTYLPIRPDDPMAVHMGTYGWILGHYRPEEPTAEDARHCFGAPDGSRCGLSAGMRVACELTIPQLHATLARSEAARGEEPPRRGMFALADGEPTLLIASQRVLLRDGMWFLISLGGEWIWGKYRQVEAEGPAAAHLFYLNEGAAFEDFCSLVPGMSVGLH